MAAPIVITGSAHLLDDTTYQVHVNALRDLATIRMRNLLHYKERKQGIILSRPELDLVNAGNEAAHAGSSLLDAFALTNPQKLSHAIDIAASKRTFQLLYRMTPAEVLQHADDRILIKALDQMGTINNRRYYDEVSERRHHSFVQDFEQLLSYRTVVGPSINKTALNACLTRMESDYKYLVHRGQILSPQDRILAREHSSPQNDLTVSAGLDGSSTDIERAPSPSPSSSQPPSSIADQARAEKYIPPHKQGRVWSRTLKRTKSFGKACKDTIVSGRLSPTSRSRRGSDARDSPASSPSRQRTSEAVATDVSAIMTGRNSPRRLAPATGLEIIPESGETGDRR